MTSGEPEQPLGALLEEASRPGAGAAVDRLLVRLADIGADAPRGGPAGSAAWREILSLRPLITRPRLLIRLDERSRGTVRLDMRRWDGTGWVTDVPADDPRRRIRSTAASFDAAPDSAGPIAVALAATDSDGRRRERAVTVMAARGMPEHLPFLVLRCDDWVRQVGVRARTALAALLRDRAEEVMPAVLPMASYLSGRHRGGAALRIVETLVEDEFDRLAPVLSAGRDRWGRRLAYTVGDRLGRWSYPDLLGFALTAPDPVVRLRSAEVVCREAVRRNDVPALRRLTAVRWAAVRSLALVGLDGLGHGDELATFLGDPSPLIRAYARSRTAGPAGHYRTVIADNPTPESIIGLAEMGARRDVPLLTSLLGHADGRVRAATVRGLTILDSVPVARIIPLLTDPSAAVVREASLALRAYRRGLPPELPWRLLSDARPEVRLAGHRLLSAHGPVIRLAAALVLAGDPDPSVARRGSAESLRLLPAVRNPWPDDQDGHLPPAASGAFVGALSPVGPGGLPGLSPVGPGALPGLSPVGPGALPGLLLALAERARPALGDRYERIHDALVKVEWRERPQ